MTTEILLVDDEQAIANVLVRSLSARGYSVHLACSGRDALSALAERVPDVMLLAINLPDLNGWEVLRRLSPTDRQRVPVIVFSASPLARSRVGEFRPAGVLLRPFPKDSLLSPCADVVAIHRSPGGASDAFLLCSCVVHRFVRGLRTVGRIPEKDLRWTSRTSSHL